MQKTMRFLTSLFLELFLDFGGFGAPKWLQKIHKQILNKLLKITSFFGLRFWMYFLWILGGFWELKIYVFLHFPYFLEVNFEARFRRVKNRKKVTFFLAFHQF